MILPILECIYYLFKYMQNNTGVLHASILIPIDTKNVLIAFIYVSISKHFKQNTPHMYNSFLLDLPVVCAIPNELRSVVD